MIWLQQGSEETTVRMQTPTRLFLLLLGVSFQVSHGFPWWDHVGLETSLWGAGRALLPGPWCSHQDVEGSRRFFRSAATSLWSLHFAMGNHPFWGFNYKELEIVWHCCFKFFCVFLFLIAIVDMLNYQRVRHVCLVVLGQGGVFMSIFIGRMSILIYWFCCVKQTQSKQRGRFDVKQYTSYRIIG